MVASTKRATQRTTAASRFAGKPFTAVSFVRQDPNEKFGLLYWTPTGATNYPDACCDGWNQGREAVEYIRDNPNDTALSLLTWAVVDLFAHTADDDVGRGFRVGFLQQVARAAAGMQLRSEV